MNGEHLMSMKDARAALRTQDWRALAALFRADPSIRDVLTSGVTLDRTYAPRTDVRVADSSEVHRLGGNDAERHMFAMVIARALGQLDDAVAVALGFDDDGAYLGGLSRLRSIDARGTLAIEMCATLPDLRKLDVDRLVGRGTLPALTDLRVGLLPIVRRHRGAGGPLDCVLDAPALETAVLHTGAELDLTTLARARGLRTLEVHCPALTQIDALANHPALRELRLGPARDGTSVLDHDVLGTIPTLESVELHDASSLAWVRHTPQLRTLRLNGRIPDLAPLAGCSTLEELSILPADGAAPLPDVSVLGSLTALRTLQLPRSGVLRASRVALRGAAALTALGKLEEVSIDIADLDIATLAVLARSTSKSLHVRGIVGCQRQAARGLEESLPVGMDARQWAEPLLAAGFPRTLPAVEDLSPDDAAALQQLNAAFKSAKTARAAYPAVAAIPRDTLVRLCGYAGLRIEQDGVVAWDSRGFRLSRVTLLGEQLLLLADAVGLLDGITYLCTRWPAHIVDLGMVARHAATLRFLHASNVDYDNESLSGDRLAAAFASVVPLATDESTAAPPSAREQILRLLLGGDLAGVEQGAQLAAVVGELEGLLAGSRWLPPSAHGWEDSTCTLSAAFLRVGASCPACKGTGKTGAGRCGTCKGTCAVNPTSPAGDAARRILEALLRAAPPGCAEAEAAMVRVTSLEDLAAGQVALVRHARNLRELALDIEQFEALAEVLATLPSLAMLTVRGAWPDGTTGLDLLRAVPQVKAIALETPVSVAFLDAVARDPSFAHIDASFGFPLGTGQPLALTAHQLATSATLTRR